VTTIIANYGYADGSGEYYITVDTDKCDGCGDCVEACASGILEVILDDYDEPKAVVKLQFATTLSDACPGYYRKCAGVEPNCHAACRAGAIRHSW
jgi:ferredoxin